MLQPVEETDGCFVGAAGPAFGPRLFGGQAIAQGLLAACGVEDMARQPHSVHASFLRSGLAEGPVHYHVTSLAEGRSFAMRRVDAVQGKTLLMTMTVSFHIEEPGFRHQADTDHSLDVDAALEALRSWTARNPKAAETPILDRLERRPIAIVPLDPGSLFGAREREPRTGSWMKLREAPAMGPSLQRAVLAYASDMMFLRNASCRRPALITQSGFTRRPTFRNGTCSQPKALGRAMLAASIAGIFTTIRAGWLQASHRKA